MKITLVTGNKNKLAEWRRLLPDDIELTAADIDLEEIQSLDLEAIVIDKAKRAYEHVGSPVLVEDVSAGLVGLGGLPGPFIKYFEIQLGEDALYKLATTDNKDAVVTCMIGYYDGARAIAARGDIRGTVVSYRGDVGFGFDHVFVPEGQTETYAEMGRAAKDAISHRSQAIKEMLRQLSLEESVSA